METAQTPVQLFPPALLSLASAALPLSPFPNFSSHSSTEATLPFSTTAFRPSASTIPLPKYFPMPMTQVGSTAPSFFRCFLSHLLDEVPDDIAWCEFGQRAPCLEEEWTTCEVAHQPSRWRIDARACSHRPWPVGSCVPSPPAGEGQGGGMRQDSCAPTLSPTLPRKRGRECTAFAAAR